MQKGKQLAIGVLRWSLLFFIWSSLSFASEAGSISGTVIDPSGAVVRAAIVIISNSGTGAHESCSTDSDGLYVFPSLPAGHYQIEIAMPAFKPYLQTGIEVVAAAAIKLDAKLELQSDATIVEVSADSLQIDASTSQMGETIAANKMTGVPLNGRSFTDLVALQPGIVPTSSQQPNAVVMSGVTSTAPSGDLNAGNTSISGQRETANGFRVNGSDVEETSTWEPLLFPILIRYRNCAFSPTVSMQNTVITAGARFSFSPSRARVDSMGMHSNFCETPTSTREIIFLLNARSLIRINLAEQSAAQSGKTECFSSRTIKELV